MGNQPSTTDKSNDYRDAFILAIRSAAILVNRDGRNRTDTILLPRQAGLPLPNIPVFSFFNSVARMGVEPATEHICPKANERRAVGTRSSDPCGIRTQPLQLERLTTSPEVERANFVVLCSSARTPSAVGREALESSSPGFQPSAMPSQLPTRHRTGSCGRTHTTSQ